MWFFSVLGFPLKKSYVEKSVASILDQREYFAFFKSISQENNNVLESLEQSHKVAEITPKWLGTFHP